MGVMNGQKGAFVMIMQATSDAEGRLIEPPLTSGHIMPVAFACPYL